MLSYKTVEFNSPVLTEYMRTHKEDEAVRILRESGLDKEVLAEMTRRIQAVMQSWADGKMRVEVLVFSNVYGELGRTEGAEEFLQILRRETRA